MIDPVTAFAAANAAFKGVKMLVGAGREIQDVSKQTQGSDNIEQQAMDIVIRKKTLLEKEKEIKFMLDYRFGLGTYDEMLGMRRKIRKEREDTVYAAMEAKRQMANNAAIGALSLGIMSVLGGGMYLIVNDQKVCVYRFSAGFGGLGYHYPTLSFSECPKVFSCVYEKKDKRPSLSEILDGLKGGF